MDQPLWQIFLNMAFVAFVARRAGIALALGDGGVMAVVDVVQCAACLFAAIAIWLRRAWVIAALLFLGFVFVAGTAIELTHASRANAAWLGIQLVFGVLASVVLSVLAYRGTASSGGA
jgi:hypothetical protein